MKYLAFTLIILTHLCPAQKQLSTETLKNVRFEKEHFGKEKRKELKKAIKHLKEGNELYEEGRAKYKEALLHFIQANKFNPNNAKLNFKIGKCYLMGTIYKLKSISYFEKAYRLDPHSNPDLLYFQGRSYQVNSEWDQAISAYKKYQESLTGLEKKVWDVRRYINQCQVGKELTANPDRIRIENLGEVINSKFAEYGVVISADESVMVFTSRRPNTTGGEKDEQMNEYFEDLYISNLLDGKWTKPKNMGKPTNSDGHDAAISLSPDGQKLLIYRLGDIYECDLKGDKWSRPRKLGKNINTDDHEPSACFSYDGRHLYFVSDNKEKSLGGYDIYVSEWNDKKSRWGPGQNLGPSINTKYNEDGVFMHPDGKTIYFSSTGHNGMGGYDIFYSTFENGSWAEPINLGYPVNSPDDDLFFVLSASGNHGYYSSFKNDGFGEKDLYQITFLPDDEPKKDDKLSMLKGFFLDYRSLDPIQATIEIFDIEDGTRVAVFTSTLEDGKFEIPLRPGRKYGMTVISEGHLLYAENFNMTPTKNNPSTELTKNIKLKELPSDRSSLNKKNGDKPFTLMGFLMDDQTLNPIEATIEIINLNDGSVFKTFSSNSETGEYSIQLPTDGDFAYRILSRGRLLYAENITIPDDGKLILNRDINLQRLARIRQTLARKSEKDLTLIKGFFRDFETLLPIEATIEVFDLEDGSLIGTFTSNSLTGKYLIPLPAGKMYGITVKADGHLFHSENFKVEAGDGFRSVNKNINLKKIKKGSQIVLKNVFYEYGKHELSQSSAVELDKIYSTLKENPNIVVEISGHTDNASSASFNQILSEKRAKAVVNFLIENGIKKEQLTFKGYGETVPIASNDMEEGRAKNRRTEFKIIETK